MRVGRVETIVELSYGGVLVVELENDVDFSTLDGCVGYWEEELIR